jgi:hypothetical protein
VLDAPCATVTPASVQLKPLAVPDNVAVAFADAPSVTVSVPDGTASPDDFALISTVHCVALFAYGSNVTPPQSSPLPENS